MLHPDLGVGLPLVPDELQAGDVLHHEGWSDVDARQDVAGEFRFVVLTEVPMLDLVRPHVLPEEELVSKYSRENKEKPGDVFYYQWRFTRLLNFLL